MQVRPRHVTPTICYGHNNIRTKTIAARYPNISDPTTTVDLLINGLRMNPITSPIGLQLMALAPMDVKNFSHKFRKIATYTTPLRYQPSPIQALTLNGTPHLYTGSLSPLHQQTPYPRPRTFRPCQHHLRKGLEHPQHTDDQCRAPDHLKKNM